MDAARPDADDGWEMSDQETISLYQVLDRATSRSQRLQTGVDSELRRAHEASLPRLRLEAQRRSANYYLTEYLAIQSRILSRRAQVQAASDEHLSDLDWISSLVRDTTDSGRAAPGELSL
jgi:hypothetical protein